MIRYEDFNPLRKFGVTVFNLQLRNFIQQFCTSNKSFAELNLRILIISSFVAGDNMRLMEAKILLLQHGVLLVKTRPGSPFQQTTSGPAPRPVQLQLPTYLQMKPSGRGPNNWNGEVEEDCSMVAQIERGYFEVRSRRRIFHHRTAPHFTHCAKPSH